ncbi:MULTISPECIES: cytochrome c3 family protein [unclassified Candidatus Frackibacter]|uniref:cytochrome c3 family protein n=1 Tax=unclassified Candidatus Frackibacter TaxID=2648818 RepID=UPI00089215CB|nr:MULTISPECIES: cytochrome c3 family protein [unclassified Candidatus Frackibacter]SDC12239.1 doubled CXXCH domain-containing protein [Candidatus Frackibacter sp. WG11]SEM35954.1 doubled CXXCH domain-containing protein [Candidatus Frackibacter sp. WG12]SFL41198.1 doubled CXXCH domain-containing protein [Candidatus Frackibacter sp. WG13]
MRKTSVIVVSILVVALFTMPAFADIQNSEHDFTASSTATRENTGGYTDLKDNTTTTCSPCHVPHNASKNTLLFQTSYNDAETLTAYNTGDTFSAETKMCMSCHDGTIAINTSTKDYMTADGTSGGTKLVENLGTSLTNDHPVGSSVTLPSSANTNFNSPSLVDAQLGGQVTCGSCHDPHNTTNGSFLETAKDGLCLDCHNK